MKRGLGRLLMVLCCSQLGIGFSLGEDAGCQQDVDRFSLINGVNS